MPRTPRTAYQMVKKTRPDGRVSIELEPATCNQETGSHLWTGYSKARGRPRLGQYCLCWGCQWDQERDTLFLEMTPQPLRRGRT